MSREKRRQYGTGSLYQRASDGLWVGVLQAGWTSTGRRRITVSAKTEAEAKRRLERRKKQLELEGTVAGISTRATVRSWCLDWLDRKKSTLKPTSLAGYTSAVNAWIIPTIGAVRLSELTPAHIRAVTKAVTASGATSTHARSVQAILQRALKAAIADGHPVPQRLLLVEAPAAATSDRTALPLNHVQAILTAAAPRHDAARWVAAFLQGMRQSECLGLTWHAVNLTAGTIDVSWQLQSIPWTHGCDMRDRQPSCGRRFARGCPKRFHDISPKHDVRHLEDAWYLTRPKTAKGKRIIPLVPWMVTALQRQLDTAIPSPHDLVWPRTDGRPLPHKTDQAAWLALQQQAGVSHPTGRPWEMHEARHTTASLLLEAGIDPEVIKAILGHSDIATSRSYMHVNQTLARKAMEAIAARLQLEPSP